MGVFIVPNELSITIATNRTISVSLDDSSAISIDEIKRLIEIYLLISKESREKAIATLGGMAIGSDVGNSDKILPLLFPNVKK